LDNRLRSVVVVGLWQALGGGQSLKIVVVVVRVADGGVFGG
jgi:hypothetical protein